MKYADQAIEKIRQYFVQNNRVVEYINQQNNKVTCSMIEDGIEVTCLSGESHKNFLPWGVFWNSVNLIILEGGSAIRGNAINFRLGEGGLPINSVEGHIARVIYGKKVGDAVFRRISPISKILILSGICLDRRGDLTISLSFLEQLFEQI